MFVNLTLVGNLGGDCQLRYLASGEPCATFDVATNRRWNDKTGAKQQETTWFRVTAWGKQAESCAEYLKKGALVLIESDKIKAEPFMGKDGKPRTQLEVTARNVRFLSTRSEQAATSNAMYPMDGDGDAIPF